MDWITLRVEFSWVSTLFLSCQEAESNSTFLLFVLLWNPQTVDINLYHLNLCCYVITKHDILQAILTHMLTNRKRMFVFPVMLSSTNIDSFQHELKKYFSFSIRFFSLTYINIKYKGTLP